MWEVPGSNLVWDTDYSYRLLVGFFIHAVQNYGMKLSDCFLLHPLEFIIGHRW